MDPIPALEGKCCWGCATELVKNQEALKVMLTSKVKIWQIAYWFQDDCVVELKATMTPGQWIRAQNLAIDMINTSMPGTALPTLHDRFGQAKEIQFRQDTDFKPSGTVEIGNALEVICHERNRRHLAEFFTSLSAQLVEANIALRLYDDLDLAQALDYSLIISPHDETVTIMFPTKQGFRTEVVRLPEDGTDLGRVMTRVARFLAEGRGRCRAVFLDNVCGLGNPDEAAELPAISRWISRIREVLWRQPVWIVVGVCLPDENPYNRLDGQEIQQLLNSEMREFNVKVLNFCESFEAEVEVEDSARQNRLDAINNELRHEEE